MMVIVFFDILSPSFEVLTYEGVDPRVLSLVAFDLAKQADWAMRSLLS